ncbi:MAG TPA: CDP-diacylglycerol--glycerol-3-phosphate 3-phosphatidyltransferase [Caulobacteraceae bacterium]|nr:CDP-diacylglycerol--glycerol-3-phosphate 3-phosphatidyltransferase [Caulobacteraceae bacterium]
MHKANPLPNILTSSRLVIGLLMFGCLAGAAGGIPFIGAGLDGEGQFRLLSAALVLFVVAAMTDFFDGMLARKLNSETQWGAVLDPIADKILICGTILGLLAQGAQPYVATIAVPSALILFREFAVSALREAGAKRGVSFPVTTLAKWKTTVQLVAYGVVLFVAAWPGLPIEMSPEVYGPVSTFAFGLVWLAAILTLWTGLDYFRTARRAIPHEAED